MTSDQDHRAGIALDESLHHRERGDHARARAVLVEALEKARERGGAISPRRRAELLFALGDVEEHAGDPASARSRFREAAEADPSFKRAALRLVERQVADGLPLRAGDVEYWIDYASLGRRGAVLKRVHLGLRDRLRIRLTEPLESIEERAALLERLHRECPTINYPKQYLGRAAYMRHEYRRAIELLASFAGAGAEAVGILNVLGRAHEKLGELSQAAAAYERSLSGDPEQPGILFRLGRIKLRLAQTS